MGGCVSQTPEEREAKSRSSAIDRGLRHDAKEFENTIKILLLGIWAVCDRLICLLIVICDNRSW